MRTFAVLVLGLFFFANAYSQVEFGNKTVAAVDVPRVRRVETPKVAPQVNIAEAERIAFDLLNKKRQENGLTALAWDDQVAAIAREHSQDMATMRYFSHKDLDGKYVSDRADSAGLRKWKAIGENIAFNKGYADPIVKAVELWMNSESHRHNLLDDHWRQSAVGVAVAPDGSYFFTQVFLKR